MIAKILKPRLIYVGVKGQSKLLVIYLVCIFVFRHLLLQQPPPPPTTLLPPLAGFCLNVSSQSLEFFKSAYPKAPIVHATNLLDEKTVFKELVNAGRGVRFVMILELDRVYTISDMDVNMLRYDLNAGLVKQNQLLERAGAVFRSTWLQQKQDWSQLIDQFNNNITTNELWSALVNSTGGRLGEYEGFAYSWWPWESQTHHTVVVQS